MRVHLAREAAAMDKATGKSSFVHSAEFIRNQKQNDKKQGEKEKILHSQIPFQSRYPINRLLFWESSFQSPLTIQNPKSSLSLHSRQSFT